ncbi:MAG TPA: IclR family transcriptional regulator C-terminal domain-containing protein [Trebonia sp.]
MHAGSRIPSYCSATGKALLAFLPQPDLDNLLDRIELQPRGPRSVGNRAALVAELGQVRRTGIALNDEELDSGLRSIGVPVRSRAGTVVAAINLAFPWSPVAMSELADQFGPALQTTARQISSLAI